MNDRKTVKYWISTEGRLNRKAFWISQLISCVVYTVISEILRAVDPGMKAAPSLLMIFAAANVIICLIQMGVFTSLWVRRLHDCGKTGKICWISFYLGIAFLATELIGFLTGNTEILGIGVFIMVACLVVGVYILIRYGFQRGTVGPNEYGPDPLEGK